MRRIRDERNFLADFYARGDVFPNLLARSTYLSKFSRDDEAWTDTIVRVVDGNADLANVNLDERKALFETFWNMRALPPGRGLWTGGVPGMPAAASYNCWSVTLRDIDDWAWMVEMLMCGGGVGVNINGFSLPPVASSEADLSVYVPEGHPDAAEVLATHANPAPGERVRYSSSTVRSPHAQYRVPDTRQGWAEALRQVLQAAFAGRSLEVDVSDIRPRGAPIRTFGGTACGPGPLVELLASVWRIVRARAGSALTDVDCLDVTTFIGKCVKAGNVRRSAIIVLGHPNSKGFRDAKKDIQPYQYNRYASNNSIVFTSEEQLRDFDYLSLAKDNLYFGEPGIINMPLIWKTDPGATGINPCFRANTRIHTRQGHFEIKDLVGREVDVWDGKSWRTVNTFAKTSENEKMLKFTLQDGSSFSVTEYHIIVLETGERVEAKDVRVGAKLLISNAPHVGNNVGTREPGAYAKGFLLGDGTSHKKEAILNLYAPKYVCFSRFADSLREIEPSMQHRTDCLLDPECRLSGKVSAVNGLRPRSRDLLPWVTTVRTGGLPKEVFAWNNASKAAFLAGYFDADGTALDSKNGFSYQVSSVHKQLLLDVQELLKTLGVRAHFGKMKAPRLSDFGDGRGTYRSQQSYRLTLGQEASRALAQRVQFSRLTSFADRGLAYSVRPRFNAVTAIEADGVDAEVYCLVTEDPDQIACSNGLIIGRCGEIPLHDREACNLAEFFPARAVDEFDLFTRTIPLLSRYALRQRLEPLEDSESEAVRLKNMRVGVGLGGICDFDWTPKLLQDMRGTVRETLRQYALEMGLSVPIANTTVKPSGTVSLLCESSPGIHAPYANFYIRRTRLAEHEPMAQALLSAGVPYERAHDDSRAMLFTFPCRHPSRVTVQNETTRDQLERQLALQTHWADNAVSATISFEGEVKRADGSTDELATQRNLFRLAALMKEFIPQVKSTSFLALAHGYAQPPYEPITEERYHELAKGIDQHHPLTKGGDMEVEECAGGACPIR